MPSVTNADVEAAADRLAGTDIAQRTPVERSRPDLPVGDADLVFEAETDGATHVDRVLKAAGGGGRGRVDHAGGVRSRNDSL